MSVPVVGQISSNFGAIAFVEHRPSRTTMSKLSSVSLQGC
jgi:hypothetical protein